MCIIIYYVCENLYVNVYNNLKVFKQYSEFFYWILSKMTI